MMAVPGNGYAAFPVKRATIAYSCNYAPTGNGIDTTHKGTADREIVRFKRKHAGDTYLRSTAIILNIISIFFGGLGLHRMYLGYWGIGIAELLGITCAV